MARGDVCRRDAIDARDRVNSGIFGFHNLSLSLLYNLPFGLYFSLGASLFSSFPSRGSSVSVRNPFFLFSPPGTLFHGQLNANECWSTYRSQDFDYIGRLDELLRWSIFLLWKAFFDAGADNRNLEKPQRFLPFQSFSILLNRRKNKIEWMQEGMLQF